MNIAITNRQKRWKIPTRDLKRVAARILNALECPTSELSVSIVGDLSIRRLNRVYLGKDRPTNVISFPMQEGEYCLHNPSLLGDVVISADTAAKEAEDGCEPFLQRLIFLLLHGILHLTGFDHERSGDAEAKRMENKEQEIFKMLKSEGFL